MESMDYQKAARVWSRVTTGPAYERQPDPLEQLIALEQQSTAVCLQLGSSKRQDATYFRHLAAKKREQTTRLMHRLHGRKR